LGLVFQPKEATLSVLNPRILVPASCAVLLTLLACGGSDDSATRIGPYDVANSVIAVDLDKDGRMDLAVSWSTWGGGPPHPGFVSRRYQDASGTLRDPIRQEAGKDPIALAAGDLDGDGIPDLVVANTQTLPGGIQENTLSLLLSGPQITVVLPPRALALGRRDPLDLALADFNGDGRLDIAVAARGGNDVLIFFQSGAAASFAAPVAFALPAEPTCLVAADLNGDGRMDLAVGLASGDVAVLLQDPIGTGPGLFRPPVTYPLGDRIAQLRAADLNGDGRPDLAVALSFGYTGQLGLLFQDPAQAGRFKPALMLDTGDEGACALAVGDLDGDGRPEIVVANAGAPGWPGSVTVFHDDGTPGSYSLRTFYAGYGGPSSVAIGDVNGDGRPDLILADGTPMVRFQDPARRGVFLPATWLKY
jgi:hypothetical protein